MAARKRQRKAVALIPIPKRLMRLELERRLPSPRGKFTDLSRQRAIRICIAWREMPIRFAHPEMERVSPAWVLIELEWQTYGSAGKTVLIVAHGNTLRAMVKYLDKTADDKIPALNIPTGVPIVYKLDDALVPVDRSHSFGDVRA